MGLLDSFLHPEKGYQAGQQQLNKYNNLANNFYEQAKAYQQPFAHIGLSQVGNLNEIINNLLNPETLRNKYLQGYQESPEAIQNEKIAQERGLNSANASGLNGSNTALNAIQNATSQISLADRNNYLKNLMDNYLHGADFVKDIYGTGANSANSLTQSAIAQALNTSNLGSSSADLAYGANNSKGNLLAGLIGPIIGGLGGLFGGSLGKGISKGINLFGGK